MGTDSHRIVYVRLYVWIRQRSSAWKSTATPGRLLFYILAASVAYLLCFKFLVPDFSFRVEHITEEDAATWGFRIRALVFVYYAVVAFCFLYLLCGHLFEPNAHFIASSDLQRFGKVGFYSLLFLGWVWCFWSSMRARLFFYDSEIFDEWRFDGQEVDTCTMPAAFVALWSFAVLVIAFIWRHKAELDKWGDRIAGK